MEACPELGTPATSIRPRNIGRPNAAFRFVNSVGIATSRISELNLQSLLPCCVRFAPTSCPVNGNTRFRPVCSTLAGRDLHPLDSNKKFHRLIFGSSSSKLFPARRQCRLCQTFSEQTGPFTPKECLRFRFVFTELFIDDQDSRVT